MMTFAQLAVERVVNSLPEGLLIAFGAWLLLRLMGRQNSGTRFAVWLVALAGVVAVPILSGLGFDSGRQDLPTLIPHAHPAVAIPAFWATTFFVLWIAIAVVALARVAAGIWQVRQIRRNCTAIPDVSLDPTLRELMSETKRPVRLLTSEKARVPAALGFRNPAIVLPAWALRDLSVDELRPILIHELAHLRRHDDWTNLAQKAIRAVLFFHPAVWWIDARLSMEREMACDDAVLATTGNPRAYAGCLIDLLEKGCARRGWSMAQAAVAHARDASVRIARILRVGSAATTRLGRAALGVATALSIAGAGVALCTPQFVGFVPMEPSSAAHVTKPLTDGGLGIQAPAMIPAAFYPARKPAVNLPVPAHCNRPPHRAAVRQIAAPRIHTVANPFVMAKFTAPNPSDEAALEPVLLVFETRDAGDPPNKTARLQTASLTQRPSAGQPSPAGTRQLQNREDPAVQIQMFEMIDPAGNRIQVVRVVLLVPQETGSASQSI
jgi:beta-lactamase regulating signal transducer with metallopeptidase domain